MNIVELIARKRNGYSLRPEEIQWIIQSYTADLIPDYQMSALLMAIYFRGMDYDEMSALTLAMVDSGESLDLSTIPGIKVDKHSTGGVGDKVSLVLAPLVAAAGVAVPMMCGRGLGHTGGTIDKLESIPGIRTRLSKKEILAQIEKIGFVIVGQSEEIAPADRKIYGLRDVTATVPSLPLISSSILSKKKAEGTDALVLDVKIGKGAFFISRKETVRLARTLVMLGNSLSIRTVALLTSMDQPLGRTVGNWLEMREAIEALRGKGPDDLMELVMELGGLMLVLSKQTSTCSDGKKILKKCLDSGDGYSKLLEMIRFQGGNPAYVEDLEKYPLSQMAVSVLSPFSGYVKRLDARKIGLVSVTAGAGRIRKDEGINPGAGIVLYKKIGEPVEKGELLATICTDKKELADSLKKQLLEAFSFSKSPSSSGNLIHTFLDEEGRFAVWE